MVLKLVDLPEGDPQGLGEQATAALIAAAIELVNAEGRGENQRGSDEGETERQQWIAQILSQVARKQGQRLSEAHVQRLASDVARRVWGLGFLDLLLPPARQDLSEITLYSRQGRLAVMPKGSVRWQNLESRVAPAEAMRVVNLILGEQAKQLSEATPIVAARLPASPHNPGGGRLNAVHACLAPGEGPSLNLRLYEQRAVQPDWLLAQGMLDEALLAFLEKQIQAGQRLLITGGTRTGKTTLLSALCNFLPVGWRIVLIEDPAEIWIDRPEVQQLEARHVPPGVQIQAVSLAELVDTALRMSPDYLVVGEVRDGAAAMALFRALLTGHAGACTFHAHSPAEAIQRLQTVLGADVGVGPEPAHQTMAASLDLIVQLGIVDEVRRVTELVAVEALAPGQRVQGEPSLKLRPLFRFDADSQPDQPRWLQQPSEEAPDDA